MKDFLKSHSLKITVLAAALIITAGVFLAVTNLGFTLKTAPESSVNAVADSQVLTQARQEVVEPLRVQIEYKEEPFKGGKDAKIVIFEFSDFQCPFCKRAAPIVKQILATYGDKVKFVYKHFPIDSHRNAQKSAEGFECAADQGKQWEFHDLLFEKGQADGSGLNVAELKQYAQQLGMNSETFNSCLDSGSKASKVQRDMQQLIKIAQSGKFADFQKGIGTPTFFINGKPLVGAQPLETFTQVIDAELATV